MSMSARYHAKQWANGKTANEIRAEIARLEAMPRHQGIEFDDDRVRHMHATTIETLRQLLQTR